MYSTVVFAYIPRTFKIMTSEEVDPQLDGLVGSGQGEAEVERGLMKT